MPTRIVAVGVKVRWVAKAVCPIHEGFAKLRGATEAPRVNRFRIKFTSAHLTFDISKARSMLGFEPKRSTVASIKA